MTNLFTAESAEEGEKNSALSGELMQQLHKKGKGRFGIVNVRSHLR